LHRIRFRAAASYPLKAGNRAEKLQKSAKIRWISVLSVQMQAGLRNYHFVAKDNGFRLIQIVSIALASMERATCDGR
jgi:hypothetical protein